MEQYCQVKTVSYTQSLHWVGELSCPMNCKKWQTISDIFEHFFSSDFSLIATHREREALKNVVNLIIRATITNKSQSMLATYCSLFHQIKNLKKKYYSKDNQFKTYIWIKDFTSSTPESNLYASSFLHASIKDVHCHTVKISLCYQLMLV